MAKTEFSLDDLAEAAIKAAQEEFDEQTKITWNQVLVSAKRFKQAYDKFKVDKENEGSFMTAFKNSIAGQLQRMNQDNSINILINDTFNDEQSGAIRALYSLAFDFDTKLKIAQGESPSNVIYVTGTGKMYRGPIQNLVFGAINTGDQARIKNLLSLSLTQIKENEYSEKFTQAYRKIRQQLNWYYNQIKGRLSDNQKQFYQKQVGYIYIAEGKYQGQYMRIQNFGDLGEGLVYAWQKWINGEISENDIYDSILEGILNVNNKAGAFGEDVGNNAVKARRAALPALAPYAELADMVIGKTKKDYLSNARESIKEHQPAVRNQIRETIPEIKLKLGEETISIDLKEIFSS